MFGLLPAFMGLHENHENEFLTDELRMLEGFIPHRDSLNTDVSKVDVAWHLDHSLKVILAIIDSLEASDHKNLKRSFNPGRTLVLVSGKIPRGGGKAPSFVMPPNEIYTQELYDQLEEAYSKLMVMDSLPKNAHFKHYAFGYLDKKDSKRFLEIHTKHHLEIIKDILK